MGAWIETKEKVSRLLLTIVASRVGAWIETYDGTGLTVNVGAVASRVGAWIETNEDEQEEIYNEVASRVGAWIETTA